MHAKADGDPATGPGIAPQGLAAPGAGHGPAAIVRELVRDLLRQQRLSAEDAGRIERALRDHDWTIVRSNVDTALARRAPIAPADSARATQHAAQAATVVAGEEVAVIAALARVALRLFDGLALMARDDPGFADRIGPLRGLLTWRLTPERLREMDERLAALLEQQAGIQENLRDARSSLKDMLGFVVQRLGAVGDSTDHFQERVGEHLEELAVSADAPTLARIMAGLLSDTHAVADVVQRSREDLAQAQRKVESYELRLRNLENELAQTARMVQNDPLTHVYNRRGLDEVFRVEVSRASRYRVPLTLVMIDLDDFKSVNDTLGHAAGDRALVHFVTTAQASLRSTELIARTGGEEFVVVFPATGIEESVDAVRRLQRELARSAFVYEGQTRVLTFSGGAALWRDSESLAQLLRRADAAMYQSKRGGKNSVSLAT